MKNSPFSIMPVGGVDEIGSNFTLIRTDTKDIVIDCGLLFPYEDFFDIDYLIPDFNFIDPNRLEAVVITHGHEDHIGALAHFIEKFPQTPIHATPFTQDLIRRKTLEKGLSPKFVDYQPSTEMAFGNITIHPISVNHSIPETFGLFIHDKEREWGALYISDFKVDLTSEHEKPIDLKKIKALMASCQKTAFFLDSTNALLKKKTPAERELLPDLEFLIAKENKRVFVTLFSSNIHRMEAMVKIAKRHGRKIVVMGRSMENYMRAGIDHNHVTSITADELWQAPQVKDEKGKMLILVSGCQGDFQSALRRLAAGEDSNFKLGPEDLVVFSSKVIPGNEKKIARIYNDITVKGAEIVTANDYHIHASGHPGQDDLHQFVSAVTPDAYFPIHGESFFLKRHCDWVIENFPQVKTEVIHNWNEVMFKTGGTFSIKTHDVHEPILIHGKGIVIERTQISQRRKMACNGSVFVSLDRVRGKCQLTALGLPIMAKELIPKLESLVMQKTKSDLSGRQDDYAVDQIKIMVRQYFQHNLGYKPVTEVHLLH